MLKKFTYQEILETLRKGLRNGNWHRLSRLERALYRASLWYARVQSVIVNDLVVSRLSLLMDKLRETEGARIFKRGMKRASEMLGKYEENGVFRWAPQWKEWLKDPDYIFYLGVMESRV